MSTESFNSHCGHDGCSMYEGREEYCAVLAADPDGYAATVAEIIDEMLIDGDLRHEGMRAGTIGERNFRHERRFFYQDAATDTLGRLPVRHMVTLGMTSSAKLGHTEYCVSDLWTVGSTEEGPTSGETNYSFDIYPAGLVQSVFESVCSIRRVDTDSRPMTEFDYEQLGKLLHDIMVHRWDATSSAET